MYFGVAPNMKNGTGLLVGGGAVDDNFVKGFANSIAVDQLARNNRANALGQAWQEYALNNYIQPNLEDEQRLHDLDQDNALRKAVQYNTQDQMFRGMITDKDLRENALADYNVFRTAPFINNNNTQTTLNNSKAGVLNSGTGVNVAHVNNNDSQMDRTLNEFGIVASQPIIDRGNALIAAIREAKAQGNPGLANQLSQELGNLFVQSDNPSMGKVKYENTQQAKTTMLQDANKEAERRKTYGQQSENRVNEYEQRRIIDQLYPNAGKGGSALKGIDGSIEVKNASFDTALESNPSFDPATIKVFNAASGPVKVAKDWQGNWVALWEGGKDENGVSILRAKPGLTSAQLQTFLDTGALPASGGVGTGAGLASDYL